VASFSPVVLASSWTVVDSTPVWLHADDDRLFYSEEEAAAILGIHRTTVRSFALADCSPVPAASLTEHKRVYRRIDLERLAG
jgi:hypothetical protein